MKTQFQIFNRDLGVNAMVTECCHLKTLVILIYFRTIVLFGINFIYLCSSLIPDLYK